MKMRRTGTVAKMIAMTAILLFSVEAIEAQPGGPGGRPLGHQDRQNHRPPSARDINRMTNTDDVQQVKQKKNVKEGDTFKLIGALSDSTTGGALSFVNVAVLYSADSSFVKGTATNLDGKFEIQGVAKGSYLLRVSAIGYQNKMIPFTMDNNTTLGVIKVKPGATTLDVVEITAEKPIYAMEGEKMIYNVTEDPSIQTGTTEDALQNAPGVEVDVEGNVTLRGVSSVEIWINDKPSKLTEENLKTYLQTLPANALARIETITNPSAKYATSAEAVINIITSAHIKSNQFVSFGVNGSNQPFVSPWISYMWAKEKMNVNLFASGRFSRRENSNEGYSRRLQDNAAGNGMDTVSYQGDTSSSDRNSLGGNIFVNVNYEFDSMTELSVDGGMFYRGNSSYSDRKTALDYFLPTVNTANYTIYNADTSHSTFGNFGADFTKKFDNEGHNLRLSLNSRIEHNHSEEYYNRNYTIYTLNPTAPNEDRYRLDNSNNYGLSFDARYNRPYSADGELSYGLSIDRSNAREIFSRYNKDVTTGEYSKIDTLRTYTFESNSTNFDADVDWTRRWGGFTLQTGIGLGYLIADYKYGSDMPFADGDNLGQFDMHPSIHLTYRTEDMHNFKLNYTLRMATPSARDLSGFRIYGDDSYSTGNKNLERSYTHSAEAGWQKFFETFGNIGIEGYGRLSTNEISSLTDATDNDEYLLNRIVSYSIPYNMGTSWRYGASLNMTYRPSGFMNVRLYANVYDFGYRMEYPKDGKIYTDHMPSWSLWVMGWAKILNQYQIHLSANYNSPTLSLMSTSKARYAINMGIRSDFFKRRLSVFINVRDIFNWGATIGSGSENTNPYYQTDNTTKMLNSRYISAGITLRFGKMELEQKVKEGSNESGDTL